MLFSFSLRFKSFNSVSSIVSTPLTVINMTISLSSNTVTSLENLLTAVGKPTILKNLLIRDIKNRISHMNLNSKLIFLNVCLARRLAPKEIMTLAKRTVSEVAANTRQVKEERRILKLRILEKRKQIADSKSLMTKGIKQAAS